MRRPRYTAGTLRVIEYIERQVQRVGDSQVGTEVGLIGCLLCKIIGGELCQVGTPCTVEAVAIPELSVRIVPCSEPEAGLRYIVGVLDTTRETDLSIVEDTLRVVDEDIAQAQCRRERPFGRIAAVGAIARAETTIGDISSLPRERSI